MTNSLARPIGLRQSLYQQVLGPDWHRLPSAIRALHAISHGHATFRGKAVVERGWGPLARLAALVVGFPAAGEDVPVEIRFACRGDGEVWTRRFGDKALRSSQWPAESREERLIAEHFGPFRILCALEPEENRLHLRVRGWSFLGLTLRPFSRLAAGPSRRIATACFTSMWRWKAR